MRDFLDPGDASLEEQPGVQPVQTLKAPGADLRALLPWLASLDPNKSVLWFILLMLAGARSVEIYNGLELVYHTMALLFAMIRANLLPTVPLTPAKGFTLGATLALFLFSGLSVEFLDALLAAGPLLPLPGTLKDVFIGPPRIPTGPPLIPGAPRDGPGGAPPPTDLLVTDAPPALWVADPSGIVAKEGPGTRYPTKTVLAFRQIVQYVGHAEGFTDAEGFRWFPIRYWDPSLERWESGFAPAQRLRTGATLLAPLGCLEHHRTRPQPCRSICIVRPVNVYSASGRLVVTGFAGTAFSCSLAPVPYRQPDPAASAPAAAPVSSPRIPVFVFSPLSGHWVGGLGRMEPEPGLGGPSPEVLFYDITVEGPIPSYAVDPALPCGRPSGSPRICRAVAGSATGLPSSAAMRAMRATS